MDKRQERMLEEVLKMPGNEVCADCKSIAPRWASVNLGIFICVGCASIHRKMGTHTSRVKSVTLDTWTREQISSIRSLGNLASNRLYNPNERLHPPPTNAHSDERDSEMEKYIRRKYEQKAFMAGSSSGSRAAPAPTSLNRARERDGRLPTEHKKDDRSWMGIGKENKLNPELNDVVVPGPTRSGSTGSGYDKALPTIPRKTPSPSPSAPPRARPVPGTPSRSSSMQNLAINGGVTGPGGGTVGAGTLVDLSGGSSSTLPLQISNFGNGVGSQAQAQAQGIGMGNMSMNRNGNMMAMGYGLSPGAAGMETGMGMAGGANGTGNGMMMMSTSPNAGQMGQISSSPSFIGSNGGGGGGYFGQQQLPVPQQPTQQFGSFGSSNGGGFGPGAGGGSWQGQQSMPLMQQQQGFLSVPSNGYQQQAGHFSSSPSNAPNGMFGSSPQMGGGGGGMMGQMQMQMQMQGQGQQAQWQMGGSPSGTAMSMGNAGGGGAGAAGMWQGQPAQGPGPGQGYSQFQGVPMGMTGMGMGMGMGMGGSGMR